jgi:hypothetical protein
MAFGGPLPLLAGFLVTTASGSPWLLIAYIGVVGLLSTIGTLTSPREFSPAVRANPAHEAHANSL